MNASCSSLAALLSLAAAGTTLPAPVEFRRDVLPILSDKCFKCHGPDKASREADLRLDLRDAALAEHDGGRPIVPGRPEESEVVTRIESTDRDEQMPPPKANMALSKKEIATLRQWIAEGAEYQAHWALVPPAGTMPDYGPRIATFAKRDAARAAELEDWPRNPIDRFTLDRLLAEGLAPTREADSATLCRRLHLALTGLPPTPAEVDAFAADSMRDPHSAIHQLADRLLASPRYGERMALEWLDAARYADTNGYFTDQERQAWPWRDWVIAAFNRNLPFDRFTIEQLAGDLLPGATVEQRIATGFNRNHMVTNETGAIEEEYRLGYVADRVDTTTTVWLGLTVGCARCHDHKYDPITQREYYQLFAAFNQIDESGIVKDVAPLSPSPAIPLPTAEQERRLGKIAAQRKERDAEMRMRHAVVETAMLAWEPGALDPLPPLPTRGSVAHFPFEKDAGAATATGKLAFIAGVKGKAAGFDATQYIEADAPLALERDRPFTFAAWIQPGGAPQGCVVSKMDSDAVARGFEILWYKSQPRISLAHRYGTDAIEVVAQWKLGGKAWRHLAVAYDGSAKAAGLKVYVDGALAPVEVRRDRLTGSVASAEPWRIAWKGTGVGFEGGIDEVRLYDRALAPEEVATLHWREFLEGALAIPRKDRARAQAEKLQARYIEQRGSQELKHLAAQIAALRSEEDAAKKTVIATSVMQEMEKPRTTRILHRGQYDAPGDAVEFAVPAALGALPAGAPRDRLGFAQWLVSRENPLTARVAVNRLWQQCFGEGLVRTTNDFGLQGEAPSHPALLDWLAVKFQETWDMKAMLKLIVTSATFRQASRFTSELLARDPENRLLARGPRFRLPAETIRDHALAASGLLVERLGGPSVKPYQPPGLWEAVSYNGEMRYEVDTGDALHRRSLYTYWKRQSPPPGMMTFDSPTREVCTVRRPRTNTPLQALVLLNDVTYVEAARALATRMLRAPEADRIAHGFRLVTARAPRGDEVAALRALCEAQLASFRQRPEAARAFLKAGEFPADPQLDPAELAAWTMTASVLLNLDETVTQH